MLSNLTIILRNGDDDDGYGVEGECGANNDDDNDDDDNNDGGRDYAVNDDRNDDDF